MNLMTIIVESYIILKINLLFSGGLKINKKKRWLRLLLMAINILSIPAISNKLE